jgi:hypothetical protein
VLPSHSTVPASVSNVSTPVVPPWIVTGYLLALTFGWRFSFAFVNSSRSLPGTTHGRLLGFDSALVVDEPTGGREA